MRSPNTPTSGRTTDTAVERHDFAVVLGLLPPYTLDDVKRAYLDKVKLVHPDHGGARGDFDRLQHAFEQAQFYLRFRPDRRQWIAARMDEYLAVVALLEELRALGAEVDTDTLDWVRHSFGDFASLTESIVGIRLANSHRAADLVGAIVREHATLQALKRLELPGCSVDDNHVLQLRVLKQLTHLDLTGTAVTSRALALVELLPALVTLEVRDTEIGWWDRVRLGHTLRKRRTAAPDPVVHPVNIR